MAAPAAGAGTASAGPSQPVPTPPDSKAKTRAGPGAHVPPVEFATMARRGGVLTADVRVAATAGIVSVRATLFDGRVEYARAGRLLRGRRGLRLNLRELRPVTPGDYVLHVTTKRPPGAARPDREARDGALTGVVGVPPGGIEPPLRA